MRKLLIKQIKLLLILILFLFVSCSGSSIPEQKEEQHQKQDPQPVTTPTNIIDYTKWNSNYAKYKIIYNTNTNAFETDCPYVSFVKKSSASDFIILNFTDIQLENKELSDSNEKMQLFKSTAQKLINDYKPDMITITGDFGDYSSNKTSLECIATYINSFNIPWAPVFGNHDNEGSVAAKSDFFEKCSNCLFKKGPTDLASIFPSGADALGNYIVNIVEDEKLINSLIFMNTGNMTFDINIFPDCAYEINNYGKLSSNQKNWYKWAINSAKAYNSNVKSSLFVHIPIYEYNVAIANAVNGNQSLSDFKKLHDYCVNVPITSSTDEQYWTKDYKGSFGVLYEALSFGTTFHDDGVFDAILKTSSTNLVIAGHDHNNNTVIKHKGVDLVYATKTGSGCYWYGPDLSGGTLINISENASEVIQLLYKPGNDVIELKRKSN